jgi:hypothetical protein
MEAASNPIFCWKSNCFDGIFKNTKSVIGRSYFLESFIFWWWDRQTKQEKIQTLLCRVTIGGQTMSKVTPHRAIGANIATLSSQPYLHGTSHSNSQQLHNVCTDWAVPHKYDCERRMATMVMASKQNTSTVLKKIASNYSVHQASGALIHFSNKGRYFD